MRQPLATKKENTRKRITVQIGLPYGMHNRNTEILHRVFDQCYARHRQEVMATQVNKILQDTEKPEGSLDIVKIEE